MSGHGAKAGSDESANRCRLLTRSGSRSPAVRRSTYGRRLSKPRRSIDIAEDGRHLLIALPASSKMLAVNFDLAHEFNFEILPPDFMPCSEKERPAALIPLLVSDRIGFNAVPFASMRERHHCPRCYCLAK